VGLGEIPDAPPVDMFYRASADERIQVAIADPDLPYGDRPLTIFVISPETAAKLISDLALALLKQARANFDY